MRASPFPQPSDRPNPDLSVGIFPRPGTARTTAIEGKGHAIVKPVWIKPEVLPIEFGTVQSCACACGGSAGAGAGDAT